MITNRSFKDFKFRHRSKKNQIIYTSKKVKNDEEVINLIDNFLIEKNDKSENIKDLLSGLKLVGDFMDKTILKPNNVSYPISRNQFINSLG